MYVGVSVCVCGCGCVLHTESGTYLPRRSADVRPVANKAPCRQILVWHFLGLLVS